MIPRLQQMKYQLIKEGLSWIQSQRTEKSIIILIGNCYLSASYKISFAMGNFDDKKSIESQYNERQTYYNSLLEKDANRQQYIADTEKYKADYEAVLAEFPSELYQDNTIMYLQGVKDKYKFNFPTVTMGEETLFYTLGAGAVGDVTVADNSSASTDAAASDVTIDESAATASGYNCYSASFPVTYEGDYKDIKDVIDYIKNGDYRMTLDDVTIAFNEQTGKYEGDMTITSYAVNGDDRTGRSRR